MPIDGPSDHNPRRAAGKGAPGANDPRSRDRSSSAGAGRPKAMTDAREAEIRHRVRTGAYNAREIVAEVARRIAASGDLKC